MIPVKMLVHYPYYEGGSYVDAVFKLLYGYDTGHLWYLPTLFVIFLIMYAAVRIFGNSKKAWAVFFALSVLMNVFRRSLPVLDGTYAPYVYQYLWSFTFGALIFQLKAEKLPKKYVYLISCIGVLSIIACLMTNSRHTYIPAVLIMIVIYAVTGDQKSEISERISRNSFGIYLFHSPLIYITFAYLLNANPMIVCGLNLFVFGPAAFMLTELVRKTGLGFMIGE